MKVLIVAPLPPPMSGNALPVKVLYEDLRKEHDVTVINLTKPRHQSGVLSLDRVAQIAKVLWAVWKRQKHYDLVYLTIAESFMGNIRDLCIYLICGSRLKTVVIHMLGGAGMKITLDRKKGLRYRANKFFLGRLGGVVVEGKPQFDMFSPITGAGRIRIIPNFAEEFLFETEAALAKNFLDADPLRILFLSNMLPGKGHRELLDAYFRLEEGLRNKIVIHFAGKLVSESDEQRFLSKIKGVSNIIYHGPVSGAQKKLLYSQAHVFCLPTYYPYEGQPFCIVEAYAAGCAVITTNHSGIGHIFRDGTNGFEVEKKSVDSLVSTLKGILNDKDALRHIAMNNLRTAREKYTQRRYLDSIKACFASVAGSKVFPAGEDGAGKPNPEKETIVKKEGEGKPFDCIIGMSGSSTAHT